MNPKLLFWSIFDRFALVLLAPKDRGRIAILRLDAIGDFVIWQAYAGAIREAFPSREVVLVCNATYQDLASRLSYWDRVIGVDISKARSQMLYRWRLLRQLRSEGFAVTLHPVYSRTAHGDLIVRAMASPVRIGMDGDETNISSSMKAVNDCWYTSLIPSSKGWQPEWRRAQDFMNGILGHEVTWKPPSLPVNLPLPTRLVGIEYFVLFPGASSPGRRWPLARFADIGRWLFESRGWVPVIAGGPDDVVIAAELCTALGPAALNLSGQTSIPELIECLRSANILISNETSAIHIAAAVETPAVGILGGGHFGRFMPYPQGSGLPLAAYEPMPCFQCNWECRYWTQQASPKPCIAAVTVGQVKTLVNQALACDKLPLHGACR